MREIRVVCNQRIFRRINIFTANTNCPHRAARISIRRIISRAINYRPIAPKPTTPAPKHLEWAKPLQSDQPPIRIGRQSMKSYVQFLTTPTADTPGTCLILHFDNKRYLIGNVSEGTQRAIVQRKIGLMKMRDIFLTGTVNWHTAGGLLGMVLTVADMVASSEEQTKKMESEKQVRKGQKTPTKPKQKEELRRTWLNIHGGRNLTHLLTTARRFIFRKGLPLITNEFRSRDDLRREGWEPSWQDENIKVWSMVLKPEVGTQARKRSHDEFVAEKPEQSEEELVEREKVDDEERKSVLTAMFDSPWRLDNLVTTTLSDVKRPAEIFHRNEDGKVEKYNGPTVDEDPSVADKEVLVRTAWPGALVEYLPPTEPSTSSICYIIRNHPQRGKFNIAEAKRLKVPRGAAYGKLTAGESIIAEDGATITPEMVLGESSKGPGFAVVDLPNSSYVAPLIARAEWSSEEVMTGVGAIVWILGEGVLADPRIQKFMIDHPELEHIVSSKDCCANYLALESPAAAAIRLNLLDSERFPIPKFSHKTQDPVVTDGKVPYEAARCGHSISMYPLVGFHDTDVVPYLDTKTVVKEASEEVVSLANIAREKIASPEYQAELDRNQEDIPSKDAEVITLGTGSALPSKYRNVSATLLRVPGYGSYLFDCGENTIGQLRRVFGDGLPEVLRDLKGIWISHLHADHHLGTASVIKAWNEETKKHDETKSQKLIVASHEHMLRWLDEYSEIEDYGHDRVWQIGFGSEDSLHYEFSPSETQSHGLASISACIVSHCHASMAVFFQFPNSFSAAYSGDCRPSKQFAKMAKGATLLIHEATFDDELATDAIHKKHSTTSEALNIGKQMNARRILLTHFSQRYQKIPVMDSHGGKEQVAVVAFDYMRVRIGDFAKLEKFKPALMELYKGENEQE